MALREVLARFGIEVEDGKLKTAAGAVDGLAGKLSGLVGVIGGAAIVNGVRNMIGEMVDLGGSLTDTSAKLGISTTALQQWQFAGGQVGVGADSMGAALGKLNRNIGEAVSGTAGARDAFKGLGIDVDGLASRPIGDVMLDAAKGLEAIKDPSAKAKAAIDLFGKSGADLIPLLGSGDEAVRALLEEASSLGGVLNEETIAALDDAGDASDKFDFAMRGVKAQIAIAVLPTLTKLGQAVLSSVVGWSKTEQGARFMRAALVTLGVVAAVAGAAMIAPFVPFIVAVAAAVLIVDDLITGLSGGDSVTGRFLDRVFGKGSGKSIFASIRADAIAFWDTVKNLGPLAALEEGLSQAGASLVRFFVEELPAAIGFASSAVQKGAAGTGEKIVIGVLSALVGLPGALYLNAGIAIDMFITGIVNGLTRGVDRVKAAASALAKTGLLGPLAVAVEAKSPSRWAERLGGHVGEGLAIGLDGSRGGVAGAARGLAGGMQRALLPGSPVGGPRTINQRNNVSVSVQGTGAGAVRSGIEQGLGGAGRAAYAALVDGVS